MIRISLKSTRRVCFPMRAPIVATMASTLGRGKLVSLAKMSLSRRTHSTLAHLPDVVAATVVPLRLNAASHHAEHRLSGSQESACGARPKNNLEEMRARIESTGSGGHGAHHTWSRQNSQLSDSHLSRQGTPRPGSRVRVSLSPAQPTTPTRSTCLISSTGAFSSASSPSTPTRFRPGPVSSPSTPARPHSTATAPSVQASLTLSTTSPSLVHAHRTTQVPPPSSTSVRSPESHTSSRRSGDIQPALSLSAHPARFSSTASPALLHTLLFYHAEPVVPLPPDARARRFIQSCSV